MMVCTQVAVSSTCGVALAGAGFFSSPRNYSPNPSGDGDYDNR